ncbi:MAG: aminotransferase class III-fold pyridoxal phosphate-dependent enzyme, partial [Acidimicrobiia bacterium]|nr:aminotransferase class III-fold pyridoxal phosphate-dependent enzyme [Acidimicrobiia bacterium]
VPEGLTHLPYNDLDAIGDAVSERTAAVLVEPVQGEGGLTPGDAAFLQRLRDLCTANGALLIFDEVQSGVGRTGWLYAYQAYGIVPDILTTAKGLGGGFPIGAMLTSEEVAQSFVPGTHGSTFGGNPLASAVAARVLEIVDDPAFLAEVRRKEALLRTFLLDLGSRRGMWHEVRGMGLWLGCVLDGEWAGRAGDIIKSAFGEGAMVLRAGADVVRLAPALNIPDADIEEGVARLDNALDRLV